MKRILATTALLFTLTGCFTPEPGNCTTNVLGGTPATCDNGTGTGG